jgi:hypothetical protein
MMSPELSYSYVPKVDAMHPKRFFELMFGPLERFFVSDQKNRIKSIFNYVRQLFWGDVEGYQACDTDYHDLEHTMECALAMSRIIAGMRKAPVDILTPMLAEYGIIAVLLHDTGYIKTSDDKVGSGAKYTRTHVDRSADFAAKHAAEYGLGKKATRAIQNMIHSTGINVNLDKIRFQSEGERVMGCCLGTADLLGQMASPRYLEKLPILFLEFIEGDIEGFSDVEDLLRKTPDFFRSFVLKRFDEEFQGVYRYLENFFPDGKNHYLLAVEMNIKRIEMILEHASDIRQ